ncbi:MAG: hypothetical protein J6C82_04940 [Clostridia bacterium]|nr:hypothetical protein [Clostridia bacterium]
MADLPAFRFDVTIYNRHKADGTTTWKRTVISGCYFGTVSGTRLNGDTVSAADTYVCRIPKNMAYTGEYQGKEGTFTLSAGDIVVKGVAVDEISDIAGHRTADLLQKYKGRAFVVRSFSDNTVLRSCPHYRVSGE